MEKKRSFALLVIVLLFSLNAFAEDIKLSPRKSFYDQVDGRKGGRSNSVYEITNTFDLKGQEIRLPEGCTLMFKGGKLVNGTLKGNHCVVKASPTCIFETVKLLGSWVNEEAYPEWFGANREEQNDDTEAIFLFLDAHIGRHLIFNGQYRLNNSQLRHAQIDSVQIDGGEFICFGAGLHLTGDNIVIRNVSLHGVNKPSSSKLNYSHTGLSLRGNNNVVENVEVYNINSCGIRVGGKGIEIYNVYSHDNQIGMVVSNNTRNIKISNSRFNDNNIVNQSGADGVLFQRTVAGVVVENCHIENNGEHGVYFQGQNAVFRNNIISNNTLDGLKFGSYDDGGFVYTDEKLNLWVDGYEGLVGFNNELGSRGYGVANISIVDNLLENNRGGDAIYFQPSATNVRIVKNEIRNNDITCSFFNYKGAKARLEDINHIEVVANTLIGHSLKDGEPSRIYISATSNVSISDNKCGRIGVYAPNNTTAPKFTAYLRECVIENNTCESIAINRAEGTIVRNNVIQWFSTNTNCSQLHVVNNAIMAQDRSIIINVIQEFSQNEVVVNCEQLCYETDTYKPTAPLLFEDNNISGGSSSVGVIGFYGTSGKSSSIKGNVVSCQNSISPLVISSERNVVVEDNVVFGKATKSSSTIILSGSGIDSKGNESNGRIDAVRGVGNKSNVKAAVIKKKVKEILFKSK